MGGDPLSPSDDGSPYGGEEGDNEEHTTVRVSREMKTLLEKIKNRTDYTSMTEMVSDMVEEGINGIQSRANAIKYFITFSNYFERKVVDMEMKRYNYEVGLVTLGELNHYINIKTKDRYSGSLSEVSTALDCSTSIVIRMCILNTLVNWIQEDRVDLDMHEQVEVRSKWDNIDMVINNMIASFTAFMQAYFVESNKTAERAVGSAGIRSQVMEGRWNELVDNVGRDRIVEQVGEEPVENLEEILEEANASYER